jgi:hypothetical protein
MWKSFVIASIFIRYLTKPAQNVLLIESPFFKIAGAAERNGSGVTEKLPLAPRRPYRVSETCAVNRFVGNEPSIRKVKSQHHKARELGHFILLVF